MKKPTKRSHYLPQTYLRHFFLDEKLEMYKKGEKFFKEEIEPEKRIITIAGEDALINFGLEKDLYNPNVPNVSPDDLEAIFRAYGEDFYNALVADIEALPNNGLIPQDIKDKLCLFMASMRVRTPQFKAEIEEMTGTFAQHDMALRYGNMEPEEIMALLKEQHGKDITLEFAKEIKEKFTKKDYSLKYPNTLFLKMALLALNQHADIYCNMTMTICRSDRYFITTDNPVVYFVPPEKVNFYSPPKSLMIPHTELFFPVTKNIGVTLNWRKTAEEVMPVGREIVDIFNYNVSHHSLDFLFSPMRMKSLEIFTKEHIPYPFKLVI